MSKTITVAKALEIALAVVGSELEAPGPLPPAMLEVMEEAGPARVARASIVATKRSLAKRLSEAFELWED